MGLQFFLVLNMLSTQSYTFVFLSDFQTLFWFKSKFVMLIWLTVWFMVCDSKTIKQRLYNFYGNNERGNILPEPRPLIKRPDNLLVVFQQLKAEYVLLGESSERSVEYPDRADSEVADRMELEMPGQAWSRAGEAQGSEAVTALLQPRRARLWTVFIQSSYRVSVTVHCDTHKEKNLLNTAEKSKFDWFIQRFHNTQFQSNFTESHSVMSRM